MRSYIGILRKTTSFNFLPFLSFLPLFSSLPFLLPSHPFHGTPKPMLLPKSTGLQCHGLGKEPTLHSLVEAQRWGREEQSYQNSWGRLFHRAGASWNYLHMQGIHGSYLNQQQKKNPYSLWFSSHQNVIYKEWLIQPSPALGTKPEAITLGQNTFSQP